MACRLSFTFTPAIPGRFIMRSKYIAITPTFTAVALSHTVSTLQSVGSHSFAMVTMGSSRRSRGRHLNRKKSFRPFSVFLFLLPLFGVRLHSTRRWYG